MTQAHRDADGGAARQDRPALELLGISKAFRSDTGVVQALVGVSMSIATGELFVLVGPSGSGKSTLLHSIAGLITPDAGRISIYGLDHTHTPVQDRNLAMVLQNLGLYPWMTVRENVEYPMKLSGVTKGERRARADELLTLLGVGALGSRNPKALSGGERQRVALARSLARNARVLLLDEPFSDLDARLRFDLRRELKLMHTSRGLTTVLVTHDQDDAMAIGDRIGLMCSGRVVECGVPGDLYSRPRTIFGATFLGRPPMSLIELEFRDGGLVCAATGAPLPVMCEMPIVGGHASVALGFRPEDLTPQQAPGPWLVDVIEAAGHRSVAFVSHGPLRLACAVGAQSLRIGDSVSLRAVRAPHAFDRASGVRIT